MNNKPIFVQTGIDFNKGKCRIKRDYWGQDWHVTDLDHYKIHAVEKAGPFKYKAEAIKAAKEANLEIVEIGY